jgi:hypothetical protein
VAEAIRARLTAHLTASMSSLERRGHCCLQAAIRSEEVFTFPDAQCDLPDVRSLPQLVDNSLLACDSNRECIVEDLAVFQFQFEYDAEFSSTPEKNGERKKAGVIHAPTR